MNPSSIKDLFDNLTALKYWSYMMPDTLEYIMKDVTIDAIHKKIREYKDKLLEFKKSTKLRDMLGIRFPVPDYFVELTMEVKGWENKTIEQAEKAVESIMRRAACGHPIHLGWKGVEPGSIKLTFILLEPVKIASNVSLDTRAYMGVITIKLDGDILYSESDDNKSLKVEFFVAIISVTIVIHVMVFIYIDRNH